MLHLQVGVTWALSALPTDSRASFTYSDDQRLHNVQIEASVVGSEDGIAIEYYSVNFEISLWFEHAGRACIHQPEMKFEAFRVISLHRLSVDQKMRELGVYRVPC